MSTLIQFRVSGEDEKSIIEAAKYAGMRPAEYVRQSARLASNRPDTALDRIEKRLLALEERLDGIGAARQTPPAGVSTIINGIEVDDLVREVRREVMRGFNAILTLLDAETLAEQNSQAPPDRSN